MANRLIEDIVVDLADLLPEMLVTDLSRSLRSYQLARFQDRFFIAPPAWFTVYMYLEAVYHVPVSAWLIWAIPNGGSALFPLLHSVFSTSYGLPRCHV